MYIITQSWKYRDSKGQRKVGTYMYIEDERKSGSLLRNSLIYG